MTPTKLSQTDVHLGSATLRLDPSGALWWPAEATLIVADLHLEKGTSFARRGTLLPPFDTRVTLERLAAVIERLDPARIVALGDSFHDADAAARLEASTETRLRALIAGRDWLWLAGNHDPAPPAWLGGEVVADGMMLGGLRFTHAAAASGADPVGVAEISGHFHPKARLAIHGRWMSLRCFVADRRRLILPAFGAYTGGLDVLDRAFRPLFKGDFTAYVLGRDRISAVPSSWLGLAAAAEATALI